MKVQIPEISLCQLECLLSRIPSSALVFVTTRPIFEFNFFILRFGAHCFHLKESEKKKGLL